MTARCSPGAFFAPGNDVASFVSVAVIYFKTGQVTKAPINIAGNALSKKILKDLTRLLVASEGLVHLMGNIVAAVVKIPVLLVVLPVCRVMSLFGVNLGHDIFKWMAEPHIAWRQLGEILFPQRALKHMADEHPVSAVERVHGSQKKMFEELGVEVGEKAACSLDAFLSVRGRSLNGALLPDAEERVQATRSGAPGLHAEPQIHRTEPRPPGSARIRASHQ